MKPIDLTIPLGIGTPAWPTYEPLEVKYFKRLAPNGANGQLVTHSNHVGTHLDGEIHFYTPGRDIASLPLDYLMHEGVVVDLGDAAGDYDIYTSKMIEERVEVRDGDILIIHTGYHHFGWDQPTADEIRYMVMHPGPDRELAEWAKRAGKRLTKSSKVYIRDTGILHNLLNIADFNELAAHPVFGFSWEGFVIENICSYLSNYESSFYRTAQGAELDLILTKGKKKIAFEFKVSDAPKLTKGFWSAIEDVQPEITFVVSPLADKYPINDNVWGIGIPGLFETLKDFRD